MIYNRPQKIAEILVEKIGVKKSKLSVNYLILMGFLAGVYIATGAQLATKVLAYVSDPGIGMLLSGSVFSVGLMLIVIAGGELFTGNSLILMSVLAGKVSVKSMLKNWSIVYLANLIGSIFMVFMMIKSGLLHHNGALNPAGDKAVNIAFIKTHLSFFQIFIRSILCNWLVCLAVWFSLAAHDISGKILGIFFPIMMFIASGFEHCIANMYLIPIGMLLNTNPSVNIPISGLMKNLTVATIGNIIGGAFFVASLYYYTYYQHREKM